MLNSSALFRFLAFGFVISFAFSCASTGFAQSGRRVHKAAPLPASTPEPAPTQTKTADKEKSMHTFIVGVDRYNGFSNIPLSFYDAVTRGCGDRLDDASSMKVEIVHRELTRGDAVNRAKAENEAYVVWLQIRVENTGADPTTVNNPSQLYIEYAVFAPTTAKTIAFGHTYQHGYRKGGVVVGPPSSTRGNIGYSEYLLKEAAREAADRILDTLKIQVSTPRVAARD